MLGPAAPTTVTATRSARPACQALPRALHSAPRLGGLCYVHRQRTRLRLSEVEQLVRGHTARKLEPQPPCLQCWCSLLHQLSPQGEGSPLGRQGKRLQGPIKQQSKIDNCTHVGHHSVAHTSARGSDGAVDSGRVPPSEVRPGHFC